MMNKEEAMAYGKRNGCKYYVYNSYGGLHGGFKTRGEAEKFKTEEENYYKGDKLNPDIKFYIREEN